MTLPSLMVTPSLDAFNAPSADQHERDRGRRTFVVRGGQTRAVPLVPGYRPDRFVQPRSQADPS
ncbi:hypothetical protein SPHINGO391_510185 [Sphingomonas aurantiaca]|jgi:hypothetical protein|uniref:Uncharacterized protein n=1 Tax=Sphingomonas aurantiaca TaxID=185949 RepID=A0A5E8AEL2_9SPHN|nr:hypothetical protein SPHINGO391_510185 [Sphingomonas aurantiaca]